MSRCVRLEPTERVPEGATVYDYDELPEAFQAELSTAAGSAGSLCLGQVEEGPIADEYVRFTEYYRVTEW